MWILPVCFTVNHLDRHPCLRTPPPPPRFQSGSWIVGRCEFCGTSKWRPQILSPSSPDGMMGWVRIQGRRSLILPTETAQQWWNFHVLSWFPFAPFSLLNCCEPLGSMLIYAERSISMSFSMSFTWTPSQTVAEAISNLWPHSPTWTFDPPSFWPNLDWFAHKRISCEPVIKLSLIKPNDQNIQ